MNRTSDQLKHRTCRASKPNGSPCSVNPQDGSDWCFFHDPTKAGKRRDAQVRGGQGNRAPSEPIDFPEFAPTAASDLVPLLVATMNRVLRGEITASVGTTVCNLAICLMKAMGVRDLEQRLYKLEQAARKIQTHESPYDPDEEDRN